MIVDGADGEVVEAWRDFQVETPLARGYEGAIAQAVNSPWSGSRSACSSSRRSRPAGPLRLVHLDLLVLLGEVAAGLRRRRPGNSRERRPMHLCTPPPNGSQA